jgi:hypothetical protein
MYLGINLTKENEDLLMKTINHGREKSKKTSEDGKTFHAHGLEETAL